MESLLNTFMGNPLGLALAGAHYLHFALPAWVVLVARMLRRRLSRLEWIVFAIFSTLIVLEAIELSVDGSFLHHELWGVARYFGVFAPLLWLWAAKAAADIWFAPVGSRAVRVALRVAVAAGLLYVAVFGNVLSIADVLANGSGREAMAAARNVAPKIRADYAGPARQGVVRRVGNEYFTARRPVVFGPFAAAAWAVRGQSEGAIENMTPSRCPYRPDYLFVCLGRRGQTDFTVDIDEKLYDYVTGVPGKKTVWGLFRRKTTPHQ